MESDKLKSDVTKYYRVVFIELWGENAKRGDKLMQQVLDIVIS